MRIRSTITIGILIAGIALNSLLRQVIIKILIDASTLMSTAMHSIPMIGVTRLDGIAYLIEFPDNGVGLLH